MSLCTQLGKLRNTLIIDVRILCITIIISIIASANNGKQLNIETEVKLFKFIVKQIALGLYYCTVAIILDPVK